jgi:Flp pilus assembly protein TadB
MSGTRGGTRDEPSAAEMVGRDGSRRRRYARGVLHCPPRQAPLQPGVDGAARRYFPLTATITSVAVVIAVLVNRKIHVAPGAALIVYAALGLAVTDGLRMWRTLSGRRVAGLSWHDGGDTGLTRRYPDLLA